MKTKFLAILSSFGALIMGCFGGACGIVCLAGGCCGGIALFGLIGISGATLSFLEKLKPVFLVVTVLSLSYAFYKAYKPKPVECCNTDKTTNEMSCCIKEQKTSFFQSKSFLWATTILCIILWLYPYIPKLNDNSNSQCCPSSNTQDTSKKPIILKYSWEK